MEAMIDVPITNKGNQAFPEYETGLSSGMDLRADEEIFVHPQTTKLVKTNLHVAIPEGYEIQIRSRSGLALKRSVFVLNSPGTIDSDYRGPIGVILHNGGDKPFRVAPGDRIAQAVLSSVRRIRWKPVDALPETQRGEDGFGSTGAS